MKLLQNALPGPVTNIFFLPITGFERSRKKAFTVPIITKPKFGAFNAEDGEVSLNYNLKVQFHATISEDGASEFQRTLNSPTFPDELLSEGIEELAAWEAPCAENGRERESANEEDFMALDEPLKKSQETLLDEQNNALKAEVAALRRLQKASFDKIDRISAEKKALQAREQKRIANGANGPHDHESDDSED